MHLTAGLLDCPASQDRVLYRAIWRKDRPERLVLRKKCISITFHGLAQKTKVFWLNWKKLQGATTTDRMGT